MEWQAVYIRETDPETKGLPVAIFRTGAIMGNWHRVAPIVIGADPVVIRTIDLPDRLVGDLGVIDVMDSATPAAVNNEGSAFERFKAEAKGELMLESIKLAARDEARRELIAAGYELPPDPNTTAMMASGERINWQGVPSYSAEEIERYRHAPPSAEDWGEDSAFRPGVYPLQGNVPYSSWVPGTVESTTPRAEGDSVGSGETTPPVVPNPDPEAQQVPQMGQLTPLEENSGGVVDDGTGKEGSEGQSEPPDTVPTGS